MMPIVLTVIAAVLAATASALPPSLTETPYDRYGPCEPLNIYNISCFDLRLLCGKRLYVRYAAGYDSTELTDAVVTVDCFLDETITATYTYSLNGHQKDAIFANLDDLGHGWIKWTVILDGQTYELQERILTVYQDGDWTDVIISSVICTYYAKNNNIMKSVIKSTDLDMVVTNEIRTMNRYFPHYPHMMAIPNAF